MQMHTITKFSFLKLVNAMNDIAESAAGPALGEPAPFFEARVGETLITLKDFSGKWLIVFSHPDDVLPLFRTRTINYLLCKRRTKVVALGSGKPAGAETGGNFLKKYILKHSLMVLDDSAGKVAESYGLTARPGGEEMKGVFIVDPSGVLRGKLLFPVHAESNFYEILKLRDALQDTDSRKTKKHFGKRAEATS